MVLPHSVLRSGQHLKWRSGFWQSQGGNTKHAVAVDFSTKTPYDLDNLEPNDFFPIASAVVFARGRESGNDFDKIKRQARVARTRTRRDVARTDRHSQVTRNSETLHHDDGEFHSPYADFASRGAAMFSTAAIFRNGRTQPDLRMAAPNTFVTYPRTSGQDKKRTTSARWTATSSTTTAYFDVYLGENIAPYVTLTP